MTTRTILFDSPFLLGFEHTRALIERAAKAASDSYPPYNVEQTGESRICITLAVAGFAPDQLSVTVEDNQLVIAGRRDQDGRTDGAYLHRGIAARGFMRSFVLADGMEVEGACLNTACSTLMWFVSSLPETSGGSQSGALTACRSPSDKLEAVR